MSWEIICEGNWWHWFPWKLVRKEREKEKACFGERLCDTVARGGCKKSVSLCSLLPVYPTDNLSVVDWSSERLSFLIRSDINKRWPVITRVHVVVPPRSFVTRVSHEWRRKPSRDLHGSVRGSFYFFFF